MPLNAQQEKVASHVNGRILVLAGPGSGKTSTLTERTGRLISGGVPPHEILCLTFTNKARDEMRDRIIRHHGELGKKVFISNFHGLCGRILRETREVQGFGYDRNMTICDKGEQVDLIQQVGRNKFEVDLSVPHAKVLSRLADEWREQAETDDWLYSQEGLNRIKVTDIRIVLEYAATLRRKNMIDFSGMLSEVHRLLSTCPYVRDRYQKRFRYIQIDEYQDTNASQNKIVELLANEQDNLLAVGDADQSIYAFRLASPKAIPDYIAAGMAKGGCEVVKLGVNYRSTPQIIAVADKLICHNPGRNPIEFSTNNPDGDPVKCVRFPTPEEEAKAIAKNIENRNNSGTPFAEMAVLYRTNDMSRLVEQALMAKEIPYVVRGSGNFYDRMEVKDLIATLRFVANPRDGISFSRIANKPKREMGAALIGNIERFAEVHGADILSVLDDAHQVTDLRGKPLSEKAVAACREVKGIFTIDTAGRPIAEVALEVLRRLRYDEWLEAEYRSKANELEERKRNLSELLNGIHQYEARNPGATLADYLESISLYTDRDNRDAEHSVQLMSLHAAKGKEFDVVFMIGLEQRILPHQKSLDAADVDEERRLCYVGFTRARKNLLVTYCLKRQEAYSRSKSAKFTNNSPSQFLLESGLLTREEYDRSAAETRSAGNPRDVDDDVYERRETAYKPLSPTKGSRQG
jgi:DNA helicase-2/ATP-dependent DNA helicase PcrA